MNDDQRSYLQGFYQSAAVYLFGCIFIGVMSQNLWPAKLAVAAAAFALLSYQCAVIALVKPPSPWHFGAFVLGCGSWVLGIAAGIGLLWR